MRIAIALVLVTLAACGSGVESAAEQKDSNRINADIERQAKAIGTQAENGAAAIERAMENEGAAIFENRARLLNEQATNGSGNAAAPRR